MSIEDLTRIVNRVAVGLPSVSLMRTRESEFTSRLEMKIAGIAADPVARYRLDDELQDFWDEAACSSSGIGVGLDDEVVIGSGIHAAIYAATRVRAGFKPPIVLESGSRPGGSFARSHRPVFRLNSRNRPGLLGLPGQNAALNYIPNGVIQPSMLSADEFQTNFELALAIRLTLLAHARVYTGVRVTDISSVGDGGYRLTLDTGTLFAGRVVQATGLGAPIPVVGYPGDSRRVLDFFQFMEHLAEPFPMARMKRVAVVGGGDSGKCALEALLGIGPRPLSVLDHVAEIDWYSNGNQTCFGFQGTERSRYKAIGSYLSRVQFPDGELLVRDDNENEEYVDQVSITRSLPREARVQVFGSRAEAVAAGDLAYVNGRPYDAVVWCAGYAPESLSNDVVAGDAVSTSNGETLLGRTNGRRFFQIGPAAAIAYDRAELGQVWARIPQNRSAIFRLAPRTAMMAMVAR